MYYDKDLVEKIKKVIQKETDEPRAKGEKDFKALHTVKKHKDPEQEKQVKEKTKKETAEPKAKGEKDFKALHTVKKHKDPEQEKQVKEETEELEEQPIHNDNKKSILRHQELAVQASKKGDKEAVKFHQDKIRKLRSQKDESLEEVKEPFAVVHNGEVLGTYSKEPNSFRIKSLARDNKVDASKLKIVKTKKKQSVGNTLKEAEEILSEADAAYLIYKDKITAMKVNNYIKKTYRNKSTVEYAPMDSKNFGVSIFAPKVQNIVKDVTKKFGKPNDSMMEEFQNMEINEL